MKKNDRFVIERLEWDSNFFEVECARIYIYSLLNSHVFNELKEEITRYNFITIDNIVGLYQNNNLISSLQGSFLVDVPLTFRYELKDHSLGSNNLQVFNNLEFNKSILSIGKDAFKLGRFYKDKNITFEKAGELYYRWLKNSFNRVDKYFVIDSNDMGFLLFSKTDDKIGLNIELIAVDDKAIGTGIGKIMIGSLKDYALKNGFKYINVVTQSDNIKAINLYSSQKFRLNKCSFTYHYWNKLEVK